MFDSSAKAIVLRTNELECEDALLNLGLKEEYFNEIGKRIVVTCSQVTANDAAAARSLYAYLTAIRALRDILCFKGGEKFNEYNLEFTSPPEKRISILVSSGNKNTGNVKYAPSTKNPKGIKTAKVVYRNYSQSCLFPDKMIPIHNRSYFESAWFLLYHLDMQNSELRMELSRPIKVDSINQKKVIVHGWAERIILPSIGFDSSDIAIDRNDYNPTPDIDFKIKRK